MFSVKMAEGVYRMQQQHARASHSHHLTNLLPHVALVAVNGARFASGFLFTKGATLEPLFRVSVQLLTFLA